MSKAPHKRKPRSIGKREYLNSAEIAQLMGYARTMERDYPGMSSDSVMWGRHIRIKEHLNRLYVAATKEISRRV